MTQASRLDASELAKASRHLVEVVDPDAVDRRLEAALEREERAAHLTRYLSISPDRAGGVRVRGRGSAEDGALLIAALLPLTCPDPAPDPETGEEPRDPRDHGARFWDALVTTAQHALTTQLPPDTHGTPPRLLVTLDHATLKADLDAAGVGTGVGTTADGTDLPPDTLRRLACDAEIIPAVLGGHGEVLDVGRLRRPVTTAIWTALVLRDRHCTFPTCRRPPADVPRPPPHPLDQRRPNRARQPRPALRPPPPRHPPHTLANTPQPHGPKTRIQTTTHTPHRPRMDPISTTPGITARRCAFSDEVLRSRVRR